MPLDPANSATMANYYDHANQGDFQGALQFLSEDVVYHIPGPPELVPYAGTWQGRDRVMLCFEAFNAAFGLVDMVETRTVAAADQVFSVNDEIFVARSTGRPWRVGVLHHMAFNAQHQISGLYNYTDIVPAVQALGGHNAVLAPVLPPEPLPGEPDVSDTVVTDLVRRYYDTFPAIGDVISDDVNALVPGDPRRLRFSGDWSGRTQILRMATHMANTLTVATRDIKDIVVEAGTAAAVVHLTGVFVPTGESFDVQGVDYFQCTVGDRIGRITSFLDTYLLTGAA